MKLEGQDQFDKTRWNCVTAGKNGTKLTCILTDSDLFQNALRTIQQEKQTELR